uniref:Uncharacterized protein n=1 Tax=Arundo donax TaxID=35708 RepID=A0A0A9FK44_ARUDO
MLKKQIKHIHAASQIIHVGNGFYLFGGSNCMLACTPFAAAGEVLVRRRRFQQMPAGSLVGAESCLRICRGCNGWIHI